MISESYYWKQELISIAHYLDSRIYTKRKWTDAQYCKVEKAIMIGFYIIRKLKEASKLTNKISATNIKAYKYKSTNTGLCLHNSHKWPNYYDLSKKIDCKLDLSFLINQFIHSFIFYPVITNCPLCKYHFTSLLFNSESEKDKFLYELDIQRIIELFNKIGNSDITYIRRIWNPKKKKYDILNEENVHEIPQYILDIIKQEEGI